MRYLASTFNSLDEEDNEEDWKPLDHTSVDNAIMDTYHADQNAVQRSRGCGLTEWKHRGGTGVQRCKFLAAIKKIDNVKNIISRPDPYEDPHFCILVQLLRQKKKCIKLP